MRRNLPSSPSVLSKLRRAVRTDGAAAAAALIWKNFRAFLVEAHGYGLDRFHNVDTRGVIPLAEMDVLLEHSNWYEPSPWFAVNKILRRLDLDFGEYAFIDYGSGKGRTLLEAARFPFARVVGLELSPALCAISKANLILARFLRRRAVKVEVVVGDATIFVLPPLPIVLYFYNPFGTEVMQGSRTMFAPRTRPRRVM